MTEFADTARNEKLKQRLRFYEDLGLAPFYRGRVPSASGPVRPAQRASAAVPAPQEVEESTLPKPAQKRPAAPQVVGSGKPFVPLTSSDPSLFDAAGKLSAETLTQIRDDLGECTRCKLHNTRNQIVFGDGNPKAQLIFIGEGPGADEDAQGLPFVGRAGKLLTQMIEAMGLKRGDVYICNVVKCRPPGNRQPEPEEVAACSPFLFRQLDSIKPKVIVCLGATAFQTLLETGRSISHYRGQWLDYRGYKLLPTYHPAYLLRNPAAKADVWKDLQKVMAELGLEVKKKAK
jgi:uracil-DNA glycosylase family 4